MQFHCEHLLAASRPAVEAALMDPDRLQMVPMVSPFVRHVHLLFCRQLGDSVDRRATITAGGLRARVGPWFLVDEVQWTDHIVWNQRRHEGIFEIQPDLPRPLRARVECRGVYRLMAEGENVTRRLIDGRIEVRVPMFGEAVAKAIVRLIGLHFDKDVDLLTTLAQAKAKVKAKAEPHELAPV